MLKCVYFSLLLIILNYCSLPSNLPEKRSKIVLNSHSQRELGHLLFFDKRLSYNNSLSCSSCHDPLLAFTDGYRVSINNLAEPLLRNSPSLLNLNERSSFNWANSKITSLQQQMERPLFGKHPTELNLEGNEQNIFSRFRKDKTYQKLYKETYDLSIRNLQVVQLIEAISSYINSLQSRNSKYDEYNKTKDSSLFNSQEWLGFQLFHSDTIACNTCHGGKDLFEPERGGQFANIGLYNCDNSYPLSDVGLQSEDNELEYNGVFRIPTLRNILITAPYYHDGSEENLVEVIKNYERQGRNITFGNCIGDGSQHPLTDGRMQKFQLDENKRKAIVAFLMCLTDTTYLRNPHFKNPFEK